MVGTRILEADANITVVIIGFWFLQKCEFHRLLKAQSDFQMRMVLYSAKAVVPLELEKTTKIKNTSFTMILLTIRTPKNIIELSQLFYI